MAPDQTVVKPFVSQVVLNKQSQMLIRTLISLLQYHQRKTVDLSLIFSRRDITAKHKVVICRTVLTIMIN